MVRRSGYDKPQPWQDEQFHLIGQQHATSPTNQSLLRRLPEQLLTSLFSRATTVRLKTDEVLFLVGDTSDGCYRVDDGLVKVAMVSRAGNERILAFLGPGATPRSLELSQPHRFPGLR